MKLGYRDLQAVMLNKGYRFFDHGAYNLNLFGIRNGSSLVNEFNDWMGVAFRDEWGNERLLLFAATTKPGLYYLKHKGYKALQQQKYGLFKVWRDADQDAQFDYQGKVYRNVRGLNGHTSSFKNDIDKVNRYSAGCQVTQDDLDFKILMAIVEKSLKYWGNSFTYTLLEERDVVFLKK